MRDEGDGSCDSFAYHRWPAATFLHFAGMQPDSACWKSKDSVIPRADKYTNRSCKICIQWMHTHMLDDNTYGEIIRVSLVSFLTECNPFATHLTIWICAIFLAPGQTSGRSTAASPEDDHASPGRTYLMIYDHGAMWETVLVWSARIQSSGSYAIWVSVKCL